MAKFASNVPIDIKPVPLILSVEAIDLALKSLPSVPPPQARLIFPSRLLTRLEVLADLASNKLARRQRPENHG